MPITSLDTLPPIRSASGAKESKSSTPKELDRRIATIVRRKRIAYGAGASAYGRMERERMLQEAAQALKSGRFYGSPSRVSTRSKPPPSMREDRDMSLSAILDRIERREAESRRGKASRDRFMLPAIDSSPKSGARDSKPKKKDYERDVLPLIAAGGGGATGGVVRSVPSKEYGWGYLRSIVRRNFGSEVKRTLERARGLAHNPWRHSVATLKSVICGKPSKGQLLLGKDIHVAGGLQDDDFEFSAPERLHLLRAIRKNNKEIATDKSNPDNITTILSFGTRFRDTDSFRPDIRSATHETFFVDDYFSSLESAKNNVLELLAVTSGRPKDSFDCIIEPTRGFPPFPAVVFRIKPGSLRTKIPVNEWFQKPCLSINEALARKKGVFVHCARGVSRSASIVILWLMYTFDLTSYEAKQVVRYQRSFVLPNPLWESLISEVDIELRVQRARIAAAGKAI